MADIKHSRAFINMIASDYEGSTNIREERMFDVIVRLVVEVDDLNRRFDRAMTDLNQGRVR